MTWATGAAIVFSMVAAYRRSRDPLHPLMFLGPMLFYMYVFRPAMLYYGNILDAFFPEEQDLVYVQTFNLLAVGLLCLGCLRFPLPQRLRRQVDRPFVPSPRLSRRLLSIGIVFGLAGLGSFVFITQRAGGLTAAFSVAKGGGEAPSGYIGDGQILTLPAIVLVILSTQGKKWSLGRLGLLALFALPYLALGILGTRRGPAFSVLFCLLAPWFLVSGRRPSLRSFLAAIGFIGMVVLLLYAHRRALYIGSEAEWDLGRLKTELTPTEFDVQTGDTYVFGSGLILSSRFHRHHFNGRRYAVILLVRPVPRQIWPTKYEDTGMGWMTDRFRPGGMTYSQWREALGWVPQAGAASGYAADMYLEMGWFGLLACFLLGCLFGWLWRNALVVKGVWTLLFAEAGVLSIYVPTQSVSAFLHRFLFMAVPTLLFWGIHVRRRKRAAPAPAAPDPFFRKRPSARGENEARSAR